MPVTPEGLPELVTRDNIKAALTALGVKDSTGIRGFEASLHEVTFMVNLQAHAGGSSNGRAEITVPIVGSGL